MSELASCSFCSSISLKPLSDDLYLCEKCDLVINNNHQIIDYNDDYFIKDYKNQYGHTYEEDYDIIYKLSRQRLTYILQLHKKNSIKEKIKLIDIGAAMGFFLKAAWDMGVRDLSGIEISEYASNYCRKHFNIDLINSSFENIDLKERYDIISAWFFIEHLKNPINIIREIFNSLNDNGIFSFSVPSIFGPLFMFNKNKWIETHPVDHSIDFSPNSIKKILKQIGFRKVYLKPCGFHPERIIKRENIFFPIFSLLYKHWSNFFAYSDTLEIYAVK